MEADFVIVGAGSAGCALAYRLSQDPRHKVIVIEAGGSDASPLIQMPGALSYPMRSSRYDWGYVSEAEPHLSHRKMVVPRGKVVGGSSSVNGMVYVRGHARDFDRWHEDGARGWAYADVLPYFKRLERWHDGGHGGDPVWRGTDGPLHVTRGLIDNPLTQAFLKAGRQAGYLATADYNGAQQEGLGPMDRTIWKGQRWSTAKAYLKAARRRHNCRLVRAFARRLLFEDRRAVGVEVLRNGRLQTIRARAEVIIAASSINSPKLLLLSGIGPACDLAKLGITLVADRAGVGKNLQDHLEYCVQMTCKRSVSLYAYWSLAGKAWVGARWLTTRSGPGASNQFEAGGFIRSRAGIDYPDIQFHFMPIAVRYDGVASAKGHGFQVHVGVQRSKSRGEVTLRSPDPRDPPRIVFNYMSEPDDWKTFRAAIRLTREILAQEAFEAFAGEELQPGPQAQCDDDIDARLREGLETAYHPCGTAKMGDCEDRTAVVDPLCRVIGVENLRLADSSIFPSIPNGNLNAPSIMVAEKAADHILGAEPLPAEDLQPCLHPKWRTVQR